MKRAGIVLVVVATMSLALPALAKGPFEVSITGPDGEKTVLGYEQNSSEMNRFLSAISFWDLAYTYADSPHRPPITDQPPTSNLGPEFVVTVGHIGPGGDAYLDVLVYPRAEGGALVHIEPDYEVVEMQATTSGGWYAPKADIATMFEEYGVAMPEVEKAQATPPAEPPSAQPVEVTALPVEPVSEGLPLWLPLVALAGGSLLVLQFVRRRTRDGLA